MNFKKTILALSSLVTIISCNNSEKKEIEKTTSKKETIVKKKPSISFKNKAHQLVYNLVEKVGNHQKLRTKKDVVYTYTYTTPDGKADISTEKYIFDGELSYGEYKQHQRTLPQLKGTMEQGYDGTNYWLKANGEAITDDASIKRVMFNRPTNFYWFTMFQKLLDPGLNYEYLGEKEIDSKKIDIVNVSFESKNDKPTDIYQLHIDKNTGLVNQFLFTVADFGVMEEPFIMQMDYETIDGILIPTKRKYKKSTWDADILDTPWTTVNWTNIKFNNGLKKEDFKN